MDGENQEENRHAVILDNMGLLHDFVEKYNRRTVHMLGGFDEVVSLLTPDYIRAIDYWLVSDRSYTLATYVWRVFRSQMIKYRCTMAPLPFQPFHKQDLQKTRERKRMLMRGDIRVFGMSALGWKQNYRNVHITHKFLHDEEMREACEELKKDLLKSLDPKRAYVITERLKGHKVRAIGREMGISHERVNQLEHTGLWAYRLKRQWKFFHLYYAKP